MHSEEDAQWSADHQYGGPHLLTEEDRLVAVQGERGAFQRLHDPQAHVGEDEEHEDVSQLKPRLVRGGNRRLRHDRRSLRGSSFPGNGSPGVEAGGDVPDPSHDPAADLAFLLSVPFFFFVSLEDDVVDSCCGDHRVLGAVKVYILFNFAAEGNFSSRRPFH